MPMVYRLCKYTEINKKTKTFISLCACFKKKKVLIIMYIIHQIKIK